MSITILRLSEFGAQMRGDLSTIGRVIIADVVSSDGRPLGLQDIKALYNIIETRMNGLDNRIDRSI